MLGTVERLRKDAGKCAVASLWPLSDADLAVVIDQVHQLEQTIAAVKLHLITEIEGRGIPAAELCRGTAAWLRSCLRLDPAAARQLVEQAAAIRRHPAVDQALCAGTIQLRQAAAICDSLDALPSVAELAASPGAAGDDGSWPVDGADAAAGEIDAAGGDDRRGDVAVSVPNLDGGGVAIGDGAATGEVQTAARVAAAAEAALLKFAGEFSPAPLRRLGARILDHVAPQVAERLDAKALERAERRAWRERGLTLSPPDCGMVRVSGHLTVEDAAIVSAAVDPLSYRGTDADFRSPAQQRADALIEVCKLALRTGDLPASGGEPPQLAVTVAYDPLARRLGVGRLDTGDRVSPAVVRRLACDAQLLPVVLGGASQVLDAGRARRLATGSLRRALVERDRGCSFPACDRSARWTDGHHIRAWTAGGPTNLDNLVLLCRRHHRLIHEGDWTVRMAGDRLPEFVPPPAFGVPQAPCRNSYHRRT